MSETFTTPPGWYADPGSADLFRWWDGTAWTAATRPKVAPVSIAPPPHPVESPSDPAARPSRPGLFAWLLALTPLIGVLLYFGLIALFDAVLPSPRLVVDRERSLALGITAVVAAAALAFVFGRLNSKAQRARRARGPALLSILTSAAAITIAVVVAVNVANTRSEPDLEAFGFSGLGPEVDAGPPDALSDAAVSSAIAASLGFDPAGVRGTVECVSPYGFQVGPTILCTVTDLDASDGILPVSAFAAVSRRDGHVYYGTYDEPLDIHRKPGDPIEQDTLYGELPESDDPYLARVEAALGEAHGLPDDGSGGSVDCSLGGDEIIELGSAFGCKLVEVSDTEGTQTTYLSVTLDVDGVLSYSIFE